MIEECPQCGRIGREIDLSSITSKTFEIEDYDLLCQVALERTDAPTMKGAQSDTEEYRFVGYLHTNE